MVGYSWLDDANSGYIHHAHNHWHGDFGFGIDRTSHLEQSERKIHYIFKKWLIFL